MSAKKKTQPTQTAPAHSFAYTALPASIAVLIVLQGGFFAGPTCAVGVCFAAAYLIAVLAGKIEPRVTPATPLLMLVGLSCLVSAFANGPSVSMAIDSCAWLALGGMALWAGALGPDDSDFAIEALCWVGVVFGGVGVLLASGLFPVEGTVNAGRLQFLFQYANTAGAWFAATSLLACASEHPRIRTLAFLPMTALLLTQSAGAITLYLMGMVILAIVLMKGKRFFELAWLPISFLVACLTFLAGQLLGGVAVAVASLLVSTLALGGKIKPLVRRISEKPRVAFATTCAATVALPLLTVAFFQQRFAQASQTLIERYIQVLDGLSVFSEAPLLGIGPDMWQHAFPLYQSAQYYASSIHCGYLQVALDSGLLGLVAFLTFAGLGLYSLVKRGEAVRLIAVGVLLTHALIDFDFQFSSIVATLVLLMYAGGGGFGAKRVEATSPEGKLRSKRVDISDAKPGARRKGASGKALAASLSALALVASLIGISFDIRKDEACSAIEPELASPTANLTVIQTLLANDPDVVTAQYSLLYQAGDYYGVLRMYEQRGAFVTSQIAFVSASLMACGDFEQAGGMMVDGLEAQPYNTELFEVAVSLFAAYGIDPAVEDRYREAVLRANELTALGNAWLLDNQVAVAELEAF